MHGPIYVIPFATLLGNDTNKGAPNESGQTVNITAVSSPTGGTVADQRHERRVHADGELLRTGRLYLHGHG